MTIAEAVSIVTVLIALIAVVVSLITANSSASKATVGDLEKIVKRQEAEIRGLKKDNDTLRDDMDELQEENRELRSELDIVKAENGRLRELTEDLQNWAEALVRQIEGKGDQPAPFRPRRRKTDAVEYATAQEAANKP